MSDAFKLVQKIKCLGCYYETEAVQNAKTGTITCLGCGHKFKVYQCRRCKFSWGSDEDVKPFKYKDAWGNEHKLCPKCHSDRWDFRIYKTTGQLFQEGEIANEIRDLTFKIKPIGITSDDRNVVEMKREPQTIRIHSSCKHPLIEKDDKLYCEVCDHYVPDTEVRESVY